MSQEERPGSLQHLHSASFPASLTSLEMIWFLESLEGLGVLGVLLQQAPGPRVVVPRGLMRVPAVPAGAMWWQL